MHDHKKIVQTNIIDIKISPIINTMLKTQHKFVRLGDKRLIYRHHHLDNVILILYFCVEVVYAP